GGTSLTYQIKQAPGSRPDPQLALHTVEALKRRIDPRGVKNFVWRPQGADRIEIQLPTTGGSTAVARQASDRLIAAEKQVRQTNVRLSDVTDAVEQINGKTREHLKELAMGDPERTKLFGEMVKTYDQIKAIEAKPVEQ